MTGSYILAGARTPIGKFLGAFADVPATELGAIVIREALTRAAIEPVQVDEVVMGNVLSAGIGQAPARQAALEAGLSPTVPAFAVNKVCGSGLKSVMLASQAIRAGDARVIVAGGMENMTQAPHLARGSRGGWKMGDVTLEDALLRDGLWCAFDDCHMGIHAEYTARENGLSREEIDEYSVTSQQRAGQAMADGLFKDEIVPVSVTRHREEILVTEDEGPRAETDMAALSRLRPVFDKSGIVTAGNASTISDGAAAVIVADRETADRTPAPWRARIVASHTSGTEPRDLFIAPVTAIRGVLDKADLTIDDIDLFEINEAFASQMLACIRQLQVDPEKVNVAGGGIALGHPIGASGTRVLVTLLSLLKQRGLRRGVASLCLGGGNAVAMIVERGT
ncbi:MAG: acetyl-CoA C-acetyltransferase [Planctomycetaceae bacterium]|jgi:acetyl-CoA C-acetyltransferase|nr:acetyl-CoA C-acetyltransferase [Planctomycetaceae bacterium]MBT6487755.1 acetyl-CoA C-acetyltransferase [Planctomycetaceae bacterium]MBT6496598.1 acetyl-CoA C-acetyltransferase [Planctomycetaceae bacterium]